MRLLPAVLLLAPLVAPLAATVAAHAEGHAVTIRNGAADTVRGVQIGPAGRLGENRMRSQLPPGAEARITYSTGCQADLRLTYASGQTEDHAGLDVCTDPRIVAGQAGVAGPATTPASSPPVSAPVSAIAARSPAAPHPGSPAKPATVQIDKTPLPPWTGRSITRRFGGMD